MKKIIKICLSLSLMSLFSLTAHSEEKETPPMSSLNLSIGLASGIHSMASDKGTSSLFPIAGFKAHIGYRIQRFLPYLGLQGLYTKAPHTELRAMDSTLTGDLLMREITYTLSTQYHTDQTSILYEDDHLYYLGGFLWASKKVSNKGMTITNGRYEPSYRLFIDGVGFQIGAGIYREHSPLFFQINYKYIRYKKAIVDEEVDDFTRTISEEYLVDDFSEHALLFTVGIQNLFKE